ncbi:hypothetical protein FIV34_09155 [Luteibacter pinisoli]|uniref:Uncharacterized protein n=1 Tax=Luteibacter pinisoli TaxID=2589080 RepID=A0A4Y5Z498_9GAMM|nr:hypothetical protein [Luteibacter pinisoli]QDE39359.1 hypothetical protein FIV34_09155 [Luteibacter pinisoli]
MTKKKRAKRMDHVGERGVVTTTATIFPIESKPVLPDVLGDGQTLPHDTPERGIRVHAAPVKTPGYVTWPGDLCAVLLDGAIIPSSVTVLPDPVPDVIELQLSKELIQGLADGPHSIAYRITPLPIGTIQESQHGTFRIDRTPPSGSLLPCIIFPERAELDGVSAAYLDSLPNAELVGTVPPYSEISRDDALDFYLRMRGSTDEHFIGRQMQVADGPCQVKIRLTLGMIDALACDGTLDVWYYVTDIAGNRSQASPSTSLRILGRGAPRVLPPPIIRGMEKGSLTEHDVKPHLHVDIPRSTPAPIPGDIVVLHFGDSSLPALPLCLGDIGDDPMLCVSIPHDIVQTETRREAWTEGGIPCQYDIVRKGVHVPSKIAFARIDPPQQ